MRDGVESMLVPLRCSLVRIGLIHLMNWVVMIMGKGKGERHREIELTD